MSVDRRTVISTFAARRWFETRERLRAGGESNWFSPVALIMRRAPLVSREVIAGVRERVDFFASDAASGVIKGRP